MITPEIVFLAPQQAERVRRAADAPAPAARPDGEAAGWTRALAADVRYAGEAFATRRAARRAAEGR